jgi:hypothetical protein
VAYAAVGLILGALRCVTTSTTPGADAAREMSMSTTRPHAIVLPTKAACAMSDGAWSAV